MSADDGDHRSVVGAQNRRRNEEFNSGTRRIVAEPIP